MAEASRAAPLAAHVFYTGRVQGVGFRATAQHLANGYLVGGWVRNLPDGRVELLAEGPWVEVESFLNALRARFAAHIDAEKVSNPPPSGEFDTFRATR